MEEIIMVSFRLMDRMVISVSRPPQQHRWFLFLLAVFLFVLEKSSSYALLLCDLPTPSLVIDLVALQRQMGVVRNTNNIHKLHPDDNNQKDSSNTMSWKPPSIRFSLDNPMEDDIILHPIPSVSNDITSGNHPYYYHDAEKSRATTTNNGNEELSISSSVWTGDAICYLHTRVTKSRTDYANDHSHDDDPLVGLEDDYNPETFLAKLDLLPTHMTSHPNDDGDDPVTATNGQQQRLPLLSYPPTLVLGLNNHHVISYYWARSAGTGAAMEAPGIVYHQGCLQWKRGGGGYRNEDTTNDGKRSEWVNFLRPGDSVQLMPHPQTILQVLRIMGIEKQRIFGISSRGRPLGSEPAVICHWQPRTRKILRMPATKAKTKK